MSTVLIVEDSPTARSLIRVFLIDLGATFIEVESAEIALSRIDDPSIDLIISDHQLPGMSGLEFVAKLRQDVRPKIRALKVVMLTSNAISEEAKAAGANAYVQKPVKGNALRNAVKELLGKT